MHYLTTITGSRVLFSIQQKYIPRKFPCHLTGENIISIFELMSIQLVHFYEAKTFSIVEEKLEDEKKL